MIATHIVSTLLCGFGLGLFASFTIDCTGKKASSLGAKRCIAALLLGFVTLGGVAGWEIADAIYEALLCG